VLFLVACSGLVSLSCTNSFFHPGHIGRASARRRGDRREMASRDVGGPAALAPPPQFPPRALTILLSALRPRSRLVICSVARASSVRVRAVLRSGPSLDCLGTALAAVVLFEIVTAARWQLLPRGLGGRGGPALLSIFCSQLNR